MINIKSTSEILKMRAAGKALSPHLFQFHNYQSESPRTLSQLYPRSNDYPLAHFCMSFSLKIMPPCPTLSRVCSTACFQIQTSLFHLKSIFCASLCRVFQLKSPYHLLKNKKSIGYAQCFYCIICAQAILLRKS